MSAQNAVPIVTGDGCFSLHNAPYARHLLTVANQQLDALGVPRIVPQSLLTRIVKAGNSGGAGSRRAALGGSVVA